VRQSGIGHGFSAGLAVGFNQSSHAQLDAPEIPHDGNEGPVEVVGAEYPVDGGTRTASRFAVIGGSEAVRAELPGITDVSGGMVLLADGLEVLVHGLFRCRLIVEGQGEGVPVELAPLGFEEAGSGLM